MNSTILLQSIVSGLLIGFVYSLIAAGLSLIFGIVELVNFAHGEFLMLAMFASFWMHDSLHLDPLVSLPITAALLALVGLIVHKALIRHVLGGPMLAQIFATFGLGLFLRSSAQYLWSADVRSIREPFLSRLFSGRIVIGNIAIGVPQVAAALLACLAFGALHLVITQTKMGLALQAVAEDKATATLMGINSDAVFALAWALGAACVGIAGAALASFYYVYPEVGVTFALIAYVVVALGGFGSVQGAFLAGILVGLVEIVSPVFLRAVHVPSAEAYKYAIVFGVYLLVVLVRPQGLFGRF